MDITTLENWLWEAACSIRGPLDAPKYKDYIHRPAAYVPAGRPTQPKACF